MDTVMHAIVIYGIKLSQAMKGYIIVNRLALIDDTPFVGSVVLCDSLYEFAGPSNWCCTDVKVIGLQHGC